MMTSFQNHYVLEDVVIFTMTSKFQWNLFYHVCQYEFLIWLTYPERNSQVMMTLFKDQYVIDDVTIFHYDVKVLVTHIIFWRLMMTSSVTNIISATSTCHQHNLSNIDLSPTYLSPMILEWHHHDRMITSRINESHERFVSPHYIMWVTIIYNSWLIA